VQRVGAAVEEGDRIGEIRAGPCGRQWTDVGVAGAIDVVEVEPSVLIDVDQSGAEGPVEDVFGSFVL
jgi:hypothetical protein